LFSGSAQRRKLRWVIKIKIFYFEEVEAAPSPPNRTSPERNPLIFIKSKTEEQTVDIPGSALLIFTA
jgi:hypothetical protein